MPSAARPSLTARAFMPLLAAAVGVPAVVAPGVAWAGPTYLESDQYVSSGTYNGATDPQVKAALPASEFTNDFSFPTVSSEVLQVSYGYDGPRVAVGSPGAGQFVDSEGFSETTQRFAFGDRGVVGRLTGAVFERTTADLGPDVGPPALSISASNQFNTRFTLDRPTRYELLPFSGVTAAAGELVTGVSLPDDGRAGVLFEYSAFISPPAVVVDDMGDTSYVPLAEYDVEIDRLADPLSPPTLRGEAASSGVLAPGEYFYFVNLFAEADAGLLGSVSFDLSPTLSLTPVEPDGAAVVPLPGAASAGLATLGGLLVAARVRSKRRA